MTFRISARQPTPLPTTQETILHIIEEHQKGAQNDSK